MSAVPDPTPGHDDQDGILPQALATIRVLLGPVSDSMAVECHQMAGMVADGDVELAGMLYERALNVKRQLRGPHDSTLAVTLHNLALIRQAEGRADEADGLWAEARRALEGDAARSG